MRVPESVTMSVLRRLKRVLGFQSLSERAPKEIFADYVRTNKWGDPDSLSGKGSNFETTTQLRHVLPELLNELDAKSLLDLPCGDFFWMQHVDLSGIDYLGGDIVPDLITANTKKFARDGCRFEVIDLIEGPVPAADVIFVRDCLVHLSSDHVHAALANIARSGGRWLLTTHFPQTGVNAEINTGQWRAIDLTKPPFSLPPPERVIVEGQAHLKGQAADKLLALWRVDVLADHIKRSR
jgi:SAM-dependent methyltransferase